MVLWREKNDRAHKYRRGRTMSCTLIDSVRAGGEWGEMKTSAKLNFLVSFVKSSAPRSILRFFSSSENGHVERGKWSCTEISSRENDIMYFDRLWTSGWGVGRKGNISKTHFFLVTWQMSVRSARAVISRGQNLPCWHWTSSRWRPTFAEGVFEGTLKRSRGGGGGGEMVGVWWWGAGSKTIKHESLHFKNIGGEIDQLSFSKIFEIASPVLSGFGIVAFC